MVESSSTASQTAAAIRVTSRFRHRENTRNPTTAWNDGKVITPSILARLIVEQTLLLGRNATLGQPSFPAGQFWPLY
jgi:hypothetical protein